MKIKLLSIVIATTFIANSMLSQSVVSDSVTLGAGYSNQVFYKLSDGTKTVVDNKNWDLQFFSSLFSASIRVNSGAGVELYKTTSQDTTSFTTTTLDTTGRTIIRDGYGNWQEDVFTSQQTGHPDYGWGKYQGLGNIIGYRIFAIKLSDGTYKKIWIKNFKTSGALTFSIADLNGTNMVERTLNRSSYNTKRHFYFDIENDSVIDNEPAKEQWEIVFRKYSDMAGPGYYSVTGALTNWDIGVAQVNKTDISTAKSNWNSYPMDSSINVIGYDWKSFNMSPPGWKIEDSLSYIIKDNNGDIYQLVFTGTTGSSAGKMFFTTERLSSVSIEENSPVLNIGVYPNPSNGVLNINFELVSTTNTTQINLIDINGRIVKSISDSFSGNGFQTIRTDISELNSGVYFLTVKSGNSIITKRVVKN